MKIRNERAITLIALIITIIIMLILAGIVLNLTIGENGLFNTAKYAVKKWNNAVIQEQSDLDELYAYINNENLPENTKDTKAGTLVAIPDKWKTNTPAYVQTSDGKEIISSKKISTVAAVATGNGETVPVPVGFWYVGGNLSTGVVISDNKKDQNKYVNEKDGYVPSGIKIENGKIVDELLGNQFVWIPSTKENYTKSNWANGLQGNVGEKSTCYWSTETDRGETLQVEKYGGFYMGRFEASLPQEKEESTENERSNSNVYNFEGIPQSKAGKVPWNCIDWNNAVKNAEKMYEKNNYVASGLITDTQWDVTINKIESMEGKSLTDSKNWGNQSDSPTFTYTGRLSQYITNTATQYPFGEVVENGTKYSNTTYLLTTGASENNKGYNLYDIAGNVWEYTQESVAPCNDLGTLQTTCSIRGGSFVQSFDACSRASDMVTGGELTNIGFRVVLYIK